MRKTDKTDYNVSDRGGGGKKYKITQGLNFFDKYHHTIDYLSYYEQNISSEKVFGLEINFILNFCSKYDFLKTFKVIKGHVRYL